MKGPWDAVADTVDLVQFALSGWPETLRLCLLLMAGGVTWRLLL